MMSGTSSTSASTTRLVDWAQLANWMYLAATGDDAVAQRAQAELDNISSGGPLPLLEEDQ